MSHEIAVVEADLNNPTHGEAIVELITHYPDGMGPEFSDSTRQTYSGAAAPLGNASVSHAQRRNACRRVRCLVGFVKQILA